MELLKENSASILPSTSLSTIVNYLTLRYFSEYFAVCVLTTEIDYILVDVPVPVIVIKIDSEYNQTFQAAVDNGCQAFIVSDSALYPFLDAFIVTHDNSDQRSSGKRLIIVKESYERLCLDGLVSHPSLLELMDVVIVVQDYHNHSIDIYSTRFYNNGTRSTVNVNIEKIEGPNYFSDKFRNMNGFPIHLSTIMYPPYSYYEETDLEKSNARYEASFKQDDVPLFLDGTEVVLILEFCRKYNCSVEASFDTEFLWGDVFDNGTGTGIMGSIVERRADIAVAAIYYLTNTYKFATYTHPLSRSGVTVLVPKPLEQPPWRTPFLCFNRYLWIAVIVVFCVGILSVWLLEKARFQILDLNDMPVTLSDSTMTMIGLYVEQNSAMKTDLLSCTFLFTSLIFAGFMVGNAYNGGLASVMTIPQHEKSIDTILDLASTGMIWGATVLPWLVPIMTAPQPYMKKLVSTYRVVEEQYLINHTKMHDMGFVGERTELQHFVPADFVDSETSNLLQLLKDDLYWASAAALVTKTCPFKQKLDDHIMQIKQSGIQYYWELQASFKYLNGTIQQTILNARSSASQSRNDIMKLTVSHFLGAFMILAVGLGLASIVFVWETSKASLGQLVSGLV